MEFRTTLPQRTAATRGLEDTVNKEKARTNQQGPDLLDNSLKQYLPSLRTFNDKKPITDLDFLRNYDAVIEKLSAKKPTTIKNYMAAGLPLTIVRVRKVLFDFVPAPSSKLLEKLTRYDTTSSTTF